MRMSIENIVDNALAVTDTSLWELQGPERDSRVVLARELIVAVARAQTPPHSYPWIAAALGRQSHTGALEAFRRLGSKYPDGRVIGVFKGKQVTFDNLVWVVSQSEAATEPATIVNLNKRATVCA